MKSQHTHTLIIHLKHKQNNYEKFYFSKKSPDPARHGSMGGASAMAQTVVKMTSSELGISNGTAVSNLEIDENITISFDKGTNSNAPKYYSTGNAIRVYGGNNFTITASTGYNIEKITFTFSSGEGTNAISADSGTFSTDTWTGEANNVKFSIGGTSGHRRIASITVTYDSNGDPIEPSKQEQQLTFSGTEFTIEEGQSFTAPTLTGAQTTVTYSSSNTGVATVNESTGDVAIVGAGTTVITATAEATNEYYEASTQYTLTIIADPGTGGTVTFDFTNPTSLGLVAPAAGNGTSINGEVVSGAVTMTATHGGTDTRIWNTNGKMDLRIYKGGSITFSVPDGYNITKITYTGAKNVPTMWTGSEQSKTTEVDATTQISTATITYTQGAAVTKQEQTLTFSGTAFAIEEGESFTAPTLTGAQTTVTYSSSNTDVATVDAETGAVTIVGVGTTTITANAAADETYYAASALYTLTVNQNLAGISLPYMMITKVGDAEFGGKNNLPTGATETGLGSDYAASQNYNNRLKFDNTEDNLVFKLADSPATLSYSIKSYGFSGGTFTVETSVDGSSYTTLKTYTKFDKAVINEIHIPLNADVRYIRWTYTSKVTGNIGLGSIYITKQGDATTMPLTISAAKYATFFSDKAFVMPEGVSGSIVTVDGTQANLTEQYVAGDIVPANTPLMLSAEQETYDAPFTAATNAQNAANLLKGALTNDVITAPAGSLLYIFANDSESGLGFYWQKNSNNGQQVQNMAGKAYLQVPTTSAVKGFRLNLGDTTGITAVESTLGNAPVYTLSGVRVSSNLNNLPAGIYIVGGKKVYVK